MNKKTVFGVLILVAVITSAFAGHMLTTWNIGEDYVIKFEGSGASGTFSDLSGTIRFDPDNLEASSFKVSVKTNTIETGNKTKNKHALGSSWLDAEKHPEITLESVEVHALDDQYEVHTIIGMHGYYKNLDIPFQFTKTETGGIFTASFTVNRQDFKIKGPFMSFMVGDEFDVQLKVPVK